MMDLDLRQVRSFMDVADLGSFSAAADKAGLTQPAIIIEVTTFSAIAATMLPRGGKTPANPRTWGWPDSGCGPVSRRP